MHYTVLNVTPVNFPTLACGTTHEGIYKHTGDLDFVSEVHDGQNVVFEEQILI